MYEKALCFRRVGNPEMERTSTHPVAPTWLV